VILISLSKRAQDYLFEQVGLEKSIPLKFCTHVKRDQQGKSVVRVWEGVCQSVTSNSYLYLEVKFCIYTSHINAEKDTNQIFERLSRSRDIVIFLILLNVVCTMVAAKLGTTLKYATIFLA